MERAGGGGGRDRGGTDRQMRTDGRSGSFALGSGKKPV